MNKEKEEGLSTLIESLLQQFDIFAQIIEAEDLKLLVETKNQLENKISYVFALYTATGMNIDTTEEMIKLKTINLLIELIKARTEFKNDILRLEEENKKKEENIALFKTLGLL